MRFALLTVLLLGATTVSANDQPLPIEEFVRHPAYSGVRISPTGEYLAMTVDRGEQDVLAVLSTKDLKLIKINQLPDGQSVGAFYWVGPQRLMFTGVRKLGSYAAPFGTGEWFGVNADGSETRPLIFYGTRDATQRSKTVSGRSFAMLDPLPDDPRHVLMQARFRQSDEGAGSELVQVDTYTGRRKLIVRAPREDCSLTLDAAKKPRFALCVDSENAQGKYDVSTELYRRDEQGDWKLVNRAATDGKDLQVLGAAPDGRIYALQDDRQLPAAFGTIDPQSGKFTELFKDPVSEVGRYIQAADGETVIALTTESGAPRVSLVDEEHPDTELYLALAQSFPGQFVDFTSATRDGQQVVVAVYSDRNPGELYLYDRGSGKARFLMKSRAGIDPARMASIKPFNFKARDGLALYGYLTLPPGSTGKQLPLIVNPHGGPMGPRDNWGFNWETQLLASRGYAVLQVNYRGSGGFGKAFLDQAYGQWAKGIQDDIVDATRWAIAQGYADADRVCIYGGSFGGYAALMAPIREPDLFKCAFGYVGMYDAAIQMDLSDTSKSEAGVRYLKRALGDTEEARAAMSPISFASELKLPIALAAGKRDPRCPPEHTEAMRDALIEAGNPPEDVIIQDGEQHGFYDEKNRLKLYTTMLAFFDRHIGKAGKVEVGPATTGSSVP